MTQPTKYTMTNVQHWIDSCIRSRDVSESSARTYANSLKVFWTWYFKKDKVKTSFPRITDIKKFRTSMYHKHRSVYSIDIYMTSLKFFFLWMLKKGKITENPMEGVRKELKRKDFTRKPLTTEQATALLQSFDKSNDSELRDYIMVAMMLVMGLRRVEVIRINIEDLKGNILFIQRKGDKAKTSFKQVPEPILNMMTRYMNGRKYLKGTSPMFTSLAHNATSHNQGISDTYISCMVKKHLRMIGINDSNITCHSLRHSCAVFMLKETGDLQRVQRHLGHSSINTTQRYVYFIDNELIMKENDTASCKIFHQLSPTKQLNAASCNI